mmetsp:Transcript_2023/g.2281  ORF Transcript_2023/g.2281 Transcript_2023/m.2281 type:complete len:1010 (+) Transcript_2023:90-3119(+)
MSNPRDIMEVKDELDERPENLISELTISEGRLLIRKNKAADDTNNAIEITSSSFSADGSHSDRPVIFNGCQRLLDILRSPPTGVTQKEGAIKAETVKDISNRNNSPDSIEIDVGVGNTDCRGGLELDLCNQKMTDELGEKGKASLTDTAPGEEIASSSGKNMKTIDEDLPYVNNLLNLVVAALNELRSMRDKSDKAKYEGDDVRSKRRKGKKASKPTKDTKGDETINTGDGDGEQWVQVRHSSEKNDEETSKEIKSASQKTQITLNTAAVLVPILTKMLDHPKRVDYKLDMKGPRIRKKEGNNRKRVKKPENIMDFPDDSKKGQCYLFFDTVYSITTLKAFENLRRDFDRLISCFPKSSPNECGTLKSTMLELLWSTCLPTSEEIIKHTFITDKSAFGKTSDCDSTKIQDFSNEVDLKLISPLAENNDQVVSAHKTCLEYLHRELTTVLSRRYCDVNLTVYGSFLSGLSLGKSDVDISLHMPQLLNLKKDHSRSRINDQTYQQKLKKIVYRVKDTITQQGRGSFFNTAAVPYARVPVVKGTFRPRKHQCPGEALNFDICFLNDIAVANSNLLREYSLIDERVRMLMLSVKSWAKTENIGSAAENTLSSYTWMIMVIFYLQCIGFVPVLQCPRFMEQHNVYYDSNNRWHNVNYLRTHFVISDRIREAVIWKLPEQFVDTSVSILLAGFYIFYYRYFPQHTTAVSIRLGKCVLQKSVFRSAKLWRLCIEDPFEVHDSHCPHDLGTPMNEDGQERVTNALRDAAHRMEEMLSKCSDIPDLIGSSTIYQRKHPENQLPSAPKGNLKKQKQQHNIVHNGKQTMNGTTNVIKYADDQVHQNDNNTYDKIKPRENKQKGHQNKQNDGNVHKKQQSPFINKHEHESQMKTKRESKIGIVQKPITANSKSQLKTPRDSHHHTTQKSGANSDKNHRKRSEHLTIEKRPLESNSQESSLDDTNIRARSANQNNTEQVEGEAIKKKKKRGRRQPNRKKLNNTNTATRETSTTSTKLVESID